MVQREQFVSAGVAKRRWNRRGVAIVRRWAFALAVVGSLAAILMVPQNTPTQSSSALSGRLAATHIAANHERASAVGINEPQQQQQQQPGDTQANNKSARDAQVTADSLHPVHIRQPDGPPRVLTGTVDFHGQPVSVACSTCHATRSSNPETRTTADLDEFHTTLKLAHGPLTCLACHNPNDYDALRLADGSRVEFFDVMTLCAQCHGTQMRDYQHGAHGGMAGYWDRRRGPRTRNNCVDCHHPHQPAFPAMYPTFKPQDRFLEPAHD